MEDHPGDGIAFELEDDARVDALHPELGGADGKERQRVLSAELDRQIVAASPGDRGRARSGPIAADIALQRRARDIV